MLQEIESFVTPGVILDGSGWSRREEGLSFRGKNLDRRTFVHLFGGLGRVEGVVVGLPLDQNDVLVGVAVDPGGAGQQRQPDRRNWVEK